MRGEPIQQQIAQYILEQHNVAYAITDRSLTVVEWAGDVRLFPSWLTDLVGRPLYDLAPELIGVEDDLYAILAGQSAELRMPYINRGAPGEAVCYVNLINLP